MKNNYSIKIEENYILLEINCRQSLKLFEELIGKVAVECRKHNINKVLIDVRMSTGSINLMEKYELAEITSVENVNLIRWGYLDDRVERADGFVGLVAGNKGIDSRLFFSFEEALRWLLQTP